MALLLMRGFDIYDNTADMFAAGSGWTRTSTLYHSFHATDGRFGGGCLKSTNASNYATITLPSPGITFGETLIVGLSFYHTGGTGPIFNIGNGANGNLMAVRHNATGDFQVDDANFAALHLEPGVLTPNTWHWIEAKVKIGVDNTSGEIEVYLNGSLITTETGVDTFRTLGGGQAQFVNLWGCNAESRFDDLIVMDITGTVNNDYLGDQRIATLNVNTAGGTDDWTPNTGTGVDAVDDALGSSDADTTYISSDTVGQQSRYSLDMTGLTYTPAGINAVQICAKGRKDDAGTRIVEGVLDNNAGSATWAGATAGLEDTYAWKFLGFKETDLAGGTWEEADLSALEFGVVLDT